MYDIVEMISPARWPLVIVLSLLSGCAAHTVKPAPTYDDGYRAGVGVCTQAMADAQGWIDNEKKRSDDLSRKLNDCLEADARSGHGK